ncbi:MAG: RIP metalloprotease RseP [Clostridia bacterium]|nr:RIP metalloprotease RseP [Clostridia bacterium]
MFNLLLSVSGFFTSALYIVLAIVVLLFMITVHEFGHYTAGKLLKFKINEFSIGFGKAIFSKTKKNGEKFSLRIFPLGGYCAFEGEDEDKPDSPDSFNNQKAWKRLIVLFMGAFFNFLSAIIFAIIFLMVFGYNDKVQIKTVEIPDGYSKPAETWFMEGDIIHAVNGTETNFVYDNYFPFLIENFDIEQEFTVSVYRDGEDIDLTIYKSWRPVLSKSENQIFASQSYALDDVNYDFVCYMDAVSDQQITDSVARGDNYKYYEIAGQKYVLKFYNKNQKNLTYTVKEGVYNTDKPYTFIQIGSSVFNVNADSVTNINDLSSIVVSSSKVGVITQNYKYGFFEAIGQSFVFCIGWAWKILIILWQLISGQLALTSIGGTVTTISTIAQVTQTNISSLLLLIPLISVNLAVFNLLPFPSLDGARMLFVFIEMIRRKPISRKVEGMIHFIGIIILLLFVLLVDILHFIV